MCLFYNLGYMLTRRLTFGFFSGFLLLTLIVVLVVAALLLKLLLMLVKETQNRNPVKRLVKHGTRGNTRPDLK